MTTDAQDKTFEEIFCRDDVTALTGHHEGDGTLWALADDDRLWRIDRDGELITPNGLMLDLTVPVTGTKLGLVGGDWDFPHEHVASYDDPRGLKESTITVIAIEDNPVAADGSRVVVFRPHGDVENEWLRMELVRFMGELGRTFPDEIRRVRRAAA